MGWGIVRAENFPLSLHSVAPTQWQLLACRSKQKQLFCPAINFNSNALSSPRVVEAFWRMQLVAKVLNWYKSYVGWWWNSLSSIFTALRKVYLFFSIWLKRLELNYCRHLLLLERRRWQNQLEKSLSLAPVAWFMMQFVELTLK